MEEPHLLRKEQLPIYLILFIYHVTNGGGMYSFTFFWTVDSFNRF